MTPELVGGDTNNSVDDADCVAAEAGPDKQTADDSSICVSGEITASGRHSDAGRWRRLLAYGLLPALAMVLALAAGYLKWADSSFDGSDLARTESVRTATEGAIAMLSYQPGTVEKDLTAARDRLTGPLKASYGSLTHDVVIPGAQQQRISAKATVPAAAAVSASHNHAVVLAFVDQTITIGSDPPTNSASRVRITLDKISGRWLIAGFDPI